EKAIKTALDAGAYGAKLTGAGGGGCVVALIDEDRLEKAVSMISEKFKVYTPRLSAEGVREEKT
ncbi:MAG: mevalonate kinase, partial [Nitrososphaerota archaeon]